MVLKYFSHRSNDVAWDFSSDPTLTLFIFVESRSAKMLVVRSGERLWGRATARNVRGERFYVPYNRYYNAIDQLRPKDR